MGPFALIADATVSTQHGAGGSLNGLEYTCRGLSEQWDADQKGPAAIAPERDSAKLFRLLELVCGFHCFTAFPK